MANIEILYPTDQPVGNKCLLNILKDSLCSTEFDSFCFISAFAKLSPFLKLNDSIEMWLDNGKTVNAYFGIDHKGTSYQALKFALARFTNVYCVYTTKSLTFHPKVYLFKGNQYSQAFFGSNNFTTGGLEINFESGVLLSLNNKYDALLIKDIDLIFEHLLPNNCAASFKLTAEKLKWLNHNNMLIDESKLYHNKATRQDIRKSLFDNPTDDLGYVPPEPFPRKIISSRKDQETGIEKDSINLSAQGLIIIIRPHNNGEIFLSKIAANQRPEFFGMPFTGSTVPKKNSNAAYPQRIPDPICDITVYNKNAQIIKYFPSYAINMVYYDKKSDIRITASEVAKITPQNSILVMSIANVEGLDYVMEIYPPGCPNYSELRSKCNQIMPSGGKEPRAFGWF